MSEDDHKSWNRLVGAAKKAGAGTSGETRPVPKTFVVRMRKLRKTLWVFAKTMLWRRWSLVAVAVALILYVFAYFLLKNDSEPSLPAPQPPKPFSP